MTKLDLDFVHHFRLPWIAAGFLLLSLAFCVNKVLTWVDLREQMERDDARIEQLEHELAAKKRAANAHIASQSAAMAEREKEETKVRKALQYPWSRVLSTFEQADTEKVAVLSFSHDASTSDTRITVEAADVAGLEEFVAKLNGGGEESAPADWYLSSYHLQAQNSPPTVIGTILEKR